MTAKVEEILTQGKINVIYNLKYRWRDEREYEDFEEYRKAIKNLFKDTAFLFVSLTKTFALRLKDNETGKVFEVKFYAGHYIVRELMS